MRELSLFLPSRCLLFLFLFHERVVTVSATFLVPPIPIPIILFPLLRIVFCSCGHRIMDSITHAFPSLGGHQ